MTPLQSLENRLAQRRRDALYRERLCLEGAQGREVQVAGQTLLAFCSNDYLGLAADPRLQQALAEGARRYGIGAGASHLVSGHSRAHRELEEALADFTGRPRALLFSTGYMANLAVISTLAGRHQHVFQDRLNHASLLDGATLSRARLRRYPHRDLAALERMLTAVAEPAAGTLIASDGVFSMDGDRAPVAGLAKLARAHQCWLLLDEAHAFGVVGAGGRGVFSAVGRLPAEELIQVGTLGKAFGGFGAFVAGEDALIETLVQEARSYIYTTALPAAVAHALTVATGIVRSEEWRRERLVALVARFRAGAAQLGLPLPASDTPIQPLVVGGSQRALALAAALRDRGILITAIRPPTVPAGGARLRVTFSASHRDADVDRLLAALEAVW
ncbi:MAG: 8-amino-7-oxononanoate synthase [Gammaproteobacteria bacterium]|nr:8-amino-7-oxononanoate synthase [Gammaproteobacteria bacterium]